MLINNVFGTLPITLMTHLFVNILSRIQKKIALRELTRSKNYYSSTFIWRSLVSRFSLTLSLPLGLQVFDSFLDSSTHVWIKHTCCCFDNSKNDEQNHQQIDSSKGNDGKHNFEISKDWNF